jgi:cyclopropane fatty-acyl-phospholipid synthase-like methyltransferase
MSNKYWENLAKNIQQPAQSRNKRPDTAEIEIPFITRYFSREDHIIDIGSGTGLIINKLIDHVAHITAVETFEGFSKFILDHPKILLITADITSFKMRKLFDGAMCTGVAQCFERNKMTTIYQNIFSMIRPEGRFISRMQCGLNEDVVVDGISEELGEQYFAEYRQVDSEIRLLKDIGFEKVEIHDIFPDSLNKWSNTRHFMFVCDKA